MEWIKVDTVNYSGFQNLILYHNPEKTFMLMKVELFSETLNVIVKGDFIEVDIKEGKYYAYSVSYDKNIIPYTIYKVS